MNEEIKKEILNLIRDTKDFAVEQAPEIIQRFIEYETIISIIWALLGLIFLVIFINRFIHYAKKDVGYREQEEYYIACAVIVIGGSLSSWIFLHNTLDLIQLIIAPKFYLIEYFLK